MKPISEWGTDEILNDIRKGHSSEMADILEGVIGDLEISEQVNRKYFAQLRSLHKELESLENPPVTSWITSDDRIRISEIKKQINSILFLK